MKGFAIAVSSRSVGEEFAEIRATRLRMHESRTHQARVRHVHNMCGRKLGALENGGAYCPRCGKVFR